MKAHLVQLEIAWEDRDANHRCVERLLADTPVNPGDLILLPELFDSGFSLDTKRTNDAEGATLQFLQELAERFRCTVQGARTILTSGDMAHNLATIVGPDGAILAEYAKIHPFSYGREQERFDGGTQIVTYPLADAIVCPAVCYDLRFPELFRFGLARGAEIFALGANWPAPRAAHWRALSIARAIENQALFLAVNRCGNDPHLAYAGGSIAVDAQGNVLAEAGADETVLTVPIDLDALRAWRDHFPAWRDARLLPRDR